MADCECKPNEIERLEALIMELKESVDFWKRDSKLETAHGLQCEEKIEELEKKIQELERMKK